MSKVVAVANQKEGVSRVISVMSLRAGLASTGKKVLLVDLDPQASLTLNLDYREPDKLEASVADIIPRVMNGEGTPEGLRVVHIFDNTDLLPSDIQFSTVEVPMVNIMNRKLVLRYYIEQAKEKYDFILIDCMPPLEVLTVNTLAFVNSILVPVQVAYLPIKGLRQLTKTIYTMRRRLNNRLSIEGILFTMVDRRTLYTEEIIEEVNKAYGKSIPAFSTEIPTSVRTSETSMVAKNTHDYDPKGKATPTYSVLTQEVLKHGC